MTTTISARPLVDDDIRPPGRMTDRVFRLLVLGVGALVLVILALILVTLFNQSLPVLRSQGLSYLTSDVWDPSKATFGTLAFTFGTMVTSAIALVLAVPVSVGIALFTTEVSPRWLKRPIVYLIDLLAAVPSVVFGLWGILVLAPALTGFYQNWHDVFSGVPVLGTLFDGNPISGRSFMTAGLILAIMVTPIITSIARETFATVPQSAKDAAHALGATRWEMIRASVFPHSRSGLVAGILIGLGRALGETIAAALVIGASPHITAELFSSGYSLPSVIANDFGEATGDYRSALIGMGVIVFVLTFIIGVVARLYVARADRRMAGEA
jgi:phosphate transport system permease protein